MQPYTLAYITKHMSYATIHFRLPVPGSGIVTGVIVIAGPYTVLVRSLSEIGKTK